jgi:adenylate cyclase
LITLVAGLLTTAIVARLGPLKALCATMLLAGSYVAFNALILFDYGHWIVGLAGPLLANAVIWGALTLTRQIIEAQERARITRRFQNYVDPTLVNYVIEHPELEWLEGEVREMTVVFTDLAGFTSFAEKLREKAVKILGRYISRMVPPIRQNNGLLHKFMGDGIMFSYGAPVANANQATDAVLTVLQMHKELERLNEMLIAEGYPRLAMRAGVNTGMAVVGDSGADDASEYACLGDTTNLAARLESANKATGTYTLLSARTVEQLAGRFLVRPIGRLVVAGKTEFVMVYEPLALAAEATDAQKRLVELTTVMVDRYVAGRFEECLAAADRLDEACGPSKLTALYRKPCLHYLHEPPEMFEGQIVLEGK